MLEREVELKDGKDTLKVVLKAPTQGFREELQERFKELKEGDTLKGFRYQRAIISRCIVEAPFKHDEESLKEVPGIWLDKLMLELTPLIGLNPDEVRNLSERRGVEKPKSSPTPTS